MDSLSRIEIYMSLRRRAVTCRRNVEETGGGVCVYALRKMRKRREKMRKRRGECGGMFC